MSWVSNMVLSVHIRDKALVPELSDWLEKDCPMKHGPKGVGFLVSLTDPASPSWGGWKHPACQVWAGTLNHAPLPTVIARVETMPWKHPGAVQLLLMDEEESYFRLWMVRDGRMQQFAPDPPSDDPRVD